MLRLNFGFLYALQMIGISLEINTTNVIEVFSVIGLQQCTKECLLRSSCTSFHYFGDHLTCYLISNVTLETVSVDMKDSLHLLRSDFSEVAIGACENHQCNFNSRCVELSSGSYDCAIIRCDTTLPVNCSWVEWQTFRVGTTNANYYCPYNSSGNAESATCTASGAWSSSAFTCLPDTISQYVSSVSDYSSQYSSISWSANQIIGTPDVYPSYRDDSSAFLPKNRNNDEFISVVFDVAVYVTEVHIYETYHGGAAYRLEMKNNDAWVTIWNTTQVSDISYARIFKPSISPPSFASNELKMTIDYTVSSSYVEYDAIKMESYVSTIESNCEDKSLHVTLHSGSNACIDIRCGIMVECSWVEWFTQIIGTEETIFHCPFNKTDNDKSVKDAGDILAASFTLETVSQYASNVSGFASEYSTDDWSAMKIVGPPDVYPEYGDLINAYSPNDRTDDQYISVVFDEKIYVTHVHIYETYHGGAVYRVLLKDEGRWTVVWETDDPMSNITVSRIFTPPLSVPSFATNELKMMINFTGDVHYVEYDAIKIIGTASRYCI